MDEIQDIEQLDNDIQQWDAAMAVALVALNAAILAELNGFLDRLVLRGRSTTSAEWAANMRAVMLFNATLPALIDRIGAGQFLTTLFVHFSETASRVNGYYGKILPGYNPEQYTGVVSQLTQQTRLLVTATMEQTYGRVVADTLTMGVLTKSTAAELRATLTARLGEEGLSVRPVATVASDALYTFSRAYTQTVAEGLNLKYYYYMGTEIATTRSFCRYRLSKAWTQTEVESWPALDWSGKIPGTNKQTIYWYCGGHKCRHRLLPVSKNTYQLLSGLAASSTTNVK